MRLSDETSGSWYGNLFGPHPRPPPQAEEGILCRLHFVHPPLAGERIGIAGKANCDVFPHPPPLAGEGMGGGVRETGDTAMGYGSGLTTKIDYGSLPAWRP